MKRELFFLTILFCSIFLSVKTLSANSRYSKGYLYFNQISAASYSNFKAYEDSITKNLRDTIKHSKSSTKTSLEASLDNKKSQLNNIKIGVANADSSIKKELKTDYFNGKLQSLKDILSNKNDSGALKINSKISADLSIENRSLYQKENPFSTGPQLLNNTSATADIKIAKVPLAFTFSTNSALDQRNRISNDQLFKINFDQNRLSRLPNGSLKKLTALKNTFSDIDIPGTITDKINAKVSKVGEIPINEFKNSTLGTYLSDPHQLFSLLALSKQNVKEKLNKLVDKEISLIKNQATDSLKTSRQILTIQNQVDTAVFVIHHVKQQLADYGIDPGQLVLLYNYLNENEDILNPDSEFLMNYLDANIQSPFLKFFLTSLKEIKGGSFGNTIPGGLSNPGVLMNGLHLSSFFKRAGQITLGLGSLNDLNSLKDMNFKSSVFSSPKYLSYLSLGTNHTYFAKGKISWLSSFSRQTQDVLHFNPSLPRNTLALTISEELNLGKLGNLSLDLSKSANQYNNTLTAGNEQLFERKNALGNYFSTDPVQTLSVGVNHHTDIKEYAMSNNLYFNYSGIGYQSPAQTGNVNPRMKFGGNIKKLFYKNKVALNLRTDFKNSPINFSSNDNWKNHQLQVETKYTINRKFKVAVSYLTSGMNKVTGGDNNLVYSSNKFQFNGNANYKIGDLFTVSHINISQQRLMNNYLSAISSDFLMVAYTQSVAFKQNTLSASLLYNKELSDYQLIGNMLNLDVNLSYSLLKKLQSSSSLTYLDNQDIARQVGIRQNFQLMTSKMFDVSVSMDIRKNIIKPLYPDLYSACRGDLMIRYYLTNKK